LMFLVDTLHRAGIGVILDWAPAHFPADAARARSLRRHVALRARGPATRRAPRLGKPRLQLRPAEVRSFLTSSAMWWLRRYHMDGIRLDAVASMLYLDYSRKEGEVGPEPLRRSREPRRDRVPARSHVRNPDGFPGCARDRRGVDGVASRDRCAERRWAGLRSQVGHGLDARHARVLPARPRVPEAQPRQGHVPADVRVVRNASCCR
jgi:hypothetical protein